MTAVDKNLKGLTAPPGLLDVRQIAGVVPLDDQFGVHPVLTHPPALGPALFEGPGETYAIIDAAKIAHFPGPEMFAPSVAASLYAGDAVEDYADSAPYLVRITRDARILQRLMTKGSGPSDLWDSGAAVFFRTSASMRDLRAHLRRFIKVRDAAGAWFYLRFWDADALPSLLRAMSEFPGDLARFFDWGRAAQIDAFVVATPRQCLHLAPRFTTPVAAQPFVLRPQYRVAFDGYAADRFFADWGETLAKTSMPRAAVLGLRDSTAFEMLAREVAGQVAPLGITRRSDLARLSVIGVYYGCYFLHDPRIAGLAQQTLAAGPFADVNIKNFDLGLQAGPLHHLLTTSDGHQWLAQTLPDALACQGALRDWLRKVMTADCGFSDDRTRDAFMQICFDQQKAVGFHADGTDTPRTRAHVLLAMLYGPYVLSDPLHHGLLALLRSGQLDQELTAEMARRLRMIKEVPHG